MSHLVARSHGSCNEQKRYAPGHRSLKTEMRDMPLIEILHNVRNSEHEQSLGPGSQESKQRNTDPFGRSMTWPSMSSITSTWIYLLKSKIVIAQQLDHRLVHKVTNLRTVLFYSTFLSPSSPNNLLDF